MKRFTQIFVLVVVAIMTFTSASFTKAATNLNDGGKMQLRLLNDRQVRAGNAISAKLQSTIRAKAELVVENAGGKKFIDMDINVKEGFNILKFKVSEIPVGVYFVKVRSENEVETISFVVK